MGPLKDIVKSIIAIANSETMEMSNKEVEIEKIIEPYYEDMKTLNKLYAGGVDNWEGYEFALSEEMEK